LIVYKQNIEREWKKGRSLDHSANKEEETWGGKMGSVRFNITG